MEQLVSERLRLIKTIEKFQADEDDDMKKVLRQLREKKRYLERLIELRELVEKPNTDIDVFKAESEEDYNRLKQLDNSIDKKTLKQMRLMKKVLTTKLDLTEDELKTVVNEINDD